MNTIIPFDKDRFESDPLRRTVFCPISPGDFSMQVPFRIPEYQERYASAKSKRERGAILAEYALKMGIGNDNPDVWRQIQADFIEPNLEKAA